MAINNFRELVESLEPVVKSIETSIPTGRNHYDAYYSFMASTRPPNMQAIMLLAMALVLAGANAEGVADAVKTFSSLN